MASFPTNQPEPHLEHGTPQKDSLASFGRALSCCNRGRACRSRSTGCCSRLDLTVVPMMVSSLGVRAHNTGPRSCFCRLCQETVDGRHLVWGRICGAATHGGTYLDIPPSLGVSFKPCSYTTLPFFLLDIHKTMISCDRLLDILLDVKTESDLNVL